MSKMTDPQYLKSEQYKDASNLNARAAIHWRFSTNPHGWNAWVFDHLGTLPAQARILELGCGPAYLWSANAARIPAGWEITLSDLSHGMLETAKAALAKTRRPFTFEVIDAQSIPYPDEHFDLVIANHMLYHVPDRPKAIQEIRRVLRSPGALPGRSPGGRLIATTVGKHHMEELNAWLQRLSPDPDFALFRMRFTLDNGLAQLQPCFRQVEIHSYDDNLRVTEIEPLMAYIHSTARGKEIPASALAQLRSELEAELQSKGAIFIQNGSGLFDAVK